MRPSILLALAVVVSASSASAQETPRWRLGVTAVGPARVLDVNSNEAPDSNSSHVDLGIGFGLEATRLWWVSSQGAFGVFARASFAKSKAETGGEEWSPGLVVMGEAGARLRRQISRAFGIFGGVGLSHWAGPDDTAPFSSLGAILVTGEGGLTVRVAPSFNIDILANATRIGSDDARGVSSGFVWRLMLGVHREK